MPIPTITPCERKKGKERQHFSFVMMDGKLRHSLTTTCSARAFIWLEIIQCYQQITLWCLGRGLVLPCPYINFCFVPKFGVYRRIAAGSGFVMFIGSRRTYQKGGWFLLEVGRQQLWGQTVPSQCTCPLLPSFQPN